MTDNSDSHLFVTVQAVNSNTHYAFMFQEDDSII